ncbi:hypothetical protein [Phenylobacterium sp.]|jgi:DNA-binding transcriptional ArsR family regulator|uniref:hypothetical protein n=1 Tax=Phenylobacterium sp. TaxID=1871053 RepID=UPI002F3FF389
MTEDSPAKGPAVDLLGDPWTPPRDPRGRKRHKRNPQVAEKVAVLRSTGSTVSDIASRLGISEPTLRQYYFRELQQGSVLARQVLTEALWKRALEGSAAAAKLVLQEMEKGDFIAPVAAAAPTASDPKLGKKEQAAVAAQSAGLDTAWGSDLQLAAPPTVN